jgi:hypothetical protein
MNPVECKPLGETICNRLIAEILKLGLSPENVSSLPNYDEAGFTTEKDTYSGMDSLVGVWKNPNGYRIGEIKVHGDGSFYAEYDVALQHPTDARWFVESVVAWGKGELIRSEARLLAALGS